MRGELIQELSPDGQLGDRPQTVESQAEGRELATKIERVVSLRPSDGPGQPGPLFKNRRGAATRKKMEANAKNQSFHSVSKDRIPNEGTHGQRFDPNLIQSKTIGTERNQLMNEAAEHDELMVENEVDRALAWRRRLCTPSTTTRCSGYRCQLWTVTTFTRRRTSCCGCGT